MTKTFGKVLALWLVFTVPAAVFVGCNVSPDNGGGDVIAGGGGGGGDVIDDGGDDTGGGANASAAPTLQGPDAFDAI